MKREEAITILKTLWNNPLFNDSHKEALNIAIEALEHPKKNVISIVSCGDAISRQAAISAIMGEYPDAHYPAYYKSKIDELPSVTPQQRIGHWIDDEFGSKCSCCGIYTHLDKFDRPMKFKCCSMCGAKMEVEE